MKWDRIEQCLFCIAYLWIGAMLFVICAAAADGQEIDESYGIAIDETYVDPYQQPVRTTYQQPVVYSQPQSTPAGCVS